MLVAAAPARPAAGAQPGRTEVVVTLPAPSLAGAMRTSRALTDAVKTRRLDLASPTSRAYLRELARLQAAAARRIRAAVPSASVRWRYRIVLDGLAVALPRSDLRLLRRVSGIEHVYPPSGIRVTSERAAAATTAEDLWATARAATGEGMKIGIIDDGVDQSHPFFDPAGYAYPPGFPKGNRSFTTPKVIVARSYVPPTTTWKYARLPFDPEQSEHGTHVAGIAAGNVVTAPLRNVATLSGMAPRAYLGNYKVLSTPSSFGLIDNAAEAAAGIEDAVKDGMDVINMSFGEFETNPERNPVDAAIDGAAKAGVVPVAAAGNSWDEFGRGSVGSPGTANLVISAAAATRSGVIASWSSGGPTPLSLRLKPDVTAPGVSILSSVPAREGTWDSFSGTSMASPYVAGAAAILLQQHPDWTVAQVASALVQTGTPVHDSQGGKESDATREGGGMVDLDAAQNPLLFAAPHALSFGLLRVGTSVRRNVRLTDAGGGAGSWTVAARLQATPDGVKVGVPSTVTVPGQLQVTVTAVRPAAEADLTGFVVLTRGSTARRIPFWVRTERPRLGPPVRALPGQGRYAGNARNGKARVSSYRYPDNPRGVELSNNLPGPEQVFRVRLRKPAANLGARIVGEGPGTDVTPRLVLAGDENRLAGVPSLPFDVNPYRNTYGGKRPTVAVIRPSAGAYDIVFDTPSRARAGRFTFRVWVDDTTPPRARLLTPSVAPSGTLVVSVADGGSGVDPSSIVAAVDGHNVTTHFSAGRVKVPLAGAFSAGTHHLVVTVSDYQETKNSESVLGILPNTRTLRATFRVR
jgi:subtilisin family serine protease